MAKHLSKEFTFMSHLGKIAKALRIEGLDREGGTNVSCQLKFWPFISSQLDLRSFVS